MKCVYVGDTVCSCELTYLMPGTRLEIQAVPWTDGDHIYFTVTYLPED